MDFYKIGSIGGTFVGSSIVLAIFGYFIEDALASEIQKNKWIIPLLVGLAGGGIFTFFFFKT